MTTIIAFIIVLGVLVLVHELGHFIIAKLAGISVPRFSIGLGPKVWGVRFGETEYVISALPLGGYVKMAGMGEEEAMERLEGGPVEEEEEVPPERRFDTKPLGTRAAVISAGVAMNFLFAIVAFAALAYSRGTYLPIVGEVQPGSPAAESGIQPGDQIIAVDGREIDRWAEFAGYVRERPGESVDLRVDREGAILALHSRIARVSQVIDTTRNDTIVFGQFGILLDTLQARRSLGLFKSVRVGVQDTWGLSVLIIEFLGQLVTGGASARDLGGPILIGQLSGQAARAGVGAFVRFMAVLSVHLAILNLLPIPILDGGWLVFLGIEAVRGRALSAEVRIKLSQIGFIVILAIMIWALTSDALRIVGQ